MGLYSYLCKNYMPGYFICIIVLFELIAMTSVPCVPNACEMVHAIHRPRTLSANNTTSAATVPLLQNHAITCPGQEI